MFWWCKVDPFSKERQNNFVQCCLPWKCISSPYALFVQSQQVTFNYVCLLLLFFLFLQKTGIDISCTQSPTETIYVKLLNCTSWKKNMKYISKCHPQKDFTPHAKHLLASTKSLVYNYMYVTKTRLFKYIESLPLKKWKLLDEKFW